MSPNIDQALALLRARATEKDMANLKRFGIEATNPIGVSMANMQAIAKQLGPSHKLALALWKTNIYEARTLAALVDVPSEVTAAQMEKWRKDFDNWGICDTVCFKLFDQAPAAWAKTREWCTGDDESTSEQQRRAGFALLASLAGHDKAASEAQFRETLPWIERAASDDRNFVKKAVLWALRRIATRSSGLEKDCRKLAEKLAKSNARPATWIGKTALREMSGPSQP